MRAVHKFWLGAALIAAGCASPAAAQGSAPCRGSAAENCETVLAFYRLGLVGLQARRAFDAHVSADFIEHKPDVPGGTREATIAFLETLIASLPQARWQILRTIAEGDLVFLHARFSPAPGAPDYAIADVFRLRDCRIVEHWDVVAGPPETQANPNPRF